MEQNPQAALNYYQKAAAQNLPEAKAKLASTRATRQQQSLPGQMSQLSVPRTAPPPPPLPPAVNIRKQSATPNADPRAGLLQAIRDGVKLKKPDSQSPSPATPATGGMWQGLLFSNSSPAMNSSSSPEEPMNTEWDEPDLKTTRPVKPPIPPQPTRPLVAVPQQGKPQSNTTPLIKKEPPTDHQNTPELTSRDALLEQIRGGIELKPAPPREQPQQADDPLMKALHATVENRRRAIVGDDD